MHLTRESWNIRRHAFIARMWLLPLVVAISIGIFILDRAMENAPVQHLYYLPIILGAYAFGSAGGITTALAAVVLYHAANPTFLIHPYQEFDFIQVALFLAIGIATAKLASDADRLRKLASTDDLTGLHNLRSFEGHLRAFVLAAREEHTPLSMMVIDVDRLKELNDRHGHLAGAEAVRKVGHLIARNIPREGVACRYGGDEFAIVIPSCDMVRAEEIAAALCKSVHGASPLLLGQVWPAGTLSISIGVAIEPHRSTRPEDYWLPAEQAGQNLFRAADEALYHSKNTGRNRVHTIEVLTA
jgi:diguanylate cyclase (GGDEF)-like protein